MHVADGIHLKSQTSNISTVLTLRTSTGVPSTAVDVDCLVHLVEARKSVSFHLELTNSWIGLETSLADYGIELFFPIHLSPWRGNFLRLTCT